MKYYFAGGLRIPDELKKAKVENVLSSWLEKSSKLYKEFDMFIDSGAFTVWKQGKTIDIKDYIEHLKEHENNINTYANLDVIGNPQGTYNNQKKMETVGLTPIPTFHLRSDFKWLKKYLDEGYEHIALGGTVGSYRDTLEPFLDTCFSIIKDYWPIKVHGFGINALWALKRYPFYSIDSTTWLSGGRFGDIFDGGKIGKKSLGRLPNLEKYSRMYNYKEMAAKNIKSFLELEKNITYLWKRKGIEW